MDFDASSHHDILIRSLLLYRFPCLVFLGYWSPIPARFPSFGFGLFFASFRFAWVSLHFV